MNEVEKERSSIVNKQHVLSLLVYFAIFMICDTVPFLPFDIDVPSKILVAVKVVTAFGFLTVLSQILMQIRSAPETSMIDQRLKINESFDVKTITHLTATPDDVVLALIEEKQRS